MIEVKELRKSFGGLQAVDSVSLTLEKGECSCVIGPNGAGKTTLFNVVTGYYKPDSGKVIFQGKDITGVSVEAICRAGIIRSFQLISIFTKLTVYENVLVSLLVRAGKSSDFLSPAKSFRREQVTAMLESVGLSDQGQVIGAQLSLGDQKRLEFAMVLAQNPQLVLLDEPTAGMSPVERVSIIELLRALASEKGLTILFTEHDMSVVFSISDRIWVMHMGKLIAEGSVEAIKENDLVRKVYLGEA